MQPASQPLLALVALVSLGAVAARPLAAQAVTQELPPGVKDLPIGFSPEERSLMRDIGRYKSLTAPPFGPVRAAGEWAESIGVFCLWPNAELMLELQKDNGLYIITQDTAWWNSWLTSNGIPTTKVQYLIAPTDTFWVRDYGPWFIWDGNQDFGLVDNTYNRPRPLDDVVPSAISTAYGVPYFGMDLIHTGGNYYADGFGNAWSTTMVYKENPGKTAAEVDQLMADYLGIDRYVTPHVPYSIEHFDTFGKLLAPDTLLWGDFPVDSTPWIYCEAELKKLRKLQSPWGWPYEIERMPLWSVGSTWTAYINSLMTMDKILMGRHNLPSDAAAKSIYEATIPGYEVVPIAAQGTDWGDSIHCRTRNFVRGDAIRIYAQPHWKLCDDDLGTHVVQAEVIPANGTALASYPVLRWSTTGGAPFQQAPMAPTGNPNEYTGWLPSQPHGTTIAYYIEAHDTAGNAKTCPLVAPAGTFTVRIEDDQAPPELDHDAIHGVIAAEWPCLVECTAVDETGIPTVALEYRINGVSQPTVTLDRDEGAFRFTGLMTGAAALGDLISYRITATDGASPPNSVSSPLLGWSWFTIDARNPILVIDLDESPDSGPLVIDVCDDLGLNAKYTTTWPANLSDHDVLFISLGMTPTENALTTAQANALVSYLNAGGSAWLEGGNAWAQATTSSIYRSYFGVTSASSGADLTAQILGESGTFTEGMLFGYFGEKKSSDHLTPAAAAGTLLSSGGAVKAVTYSTGTYQSVGSSFQAADLLEDRAPSHVKYLVAQVLDYLGAGIDLVVHTTLEAPTQYTIDLQGDPSGAWFLFFSQTPGYLPLGPAGIVELDLATAKLGGYGAFPGSGTFRQSFFMPTDPALAGIEIYLQGYVQKVAPAAFFVTNRDRLAIGG